MVERLSKLEANRRLRKRIDRIKNEFAKIDKCFAGRMEEDEKDLSEEEYMRKWRRSKGWRSRGWRVLLGTHDLVRSLQSTLFQNPGEV